MNIKENWVNISDLSQAEIDQINGVTTKRNSQLPISNKKTKVEKKLSASTKTNNVLEYSVGLGFGNSGR